MTVLDDPRSKRKVWNGRVQEDSEHGGQRRAAAADLHRASFPEARRNVDRASAVAHDGRLGKADPRPEMEGEGCRGTSARYAASEALRFPRPPRTRISEDHFSRGPYNAHQLVECGGRQEVPRAKPSRIDYKDGVGFNRKRRISPVARSIRGGDVPCELGWRGRSRKLVRQRPRAHRALAPSAADQNRRR